MIVPALRGCSSRCSQETSGAVGNSCYDIHTDPPLTEINAAGKFNTNVTVGMCAETGSLDHATRDLLQIFQLHIGADPAIRALNNTRAPFLSCDPSSPQFLGSRRSKLGNLVASLGSLFVPRPLFARTTAALDLGAGGPHVGSAQVTADMSVDPGAEIEAAVVRANSDAGRIASRGSPQDFPASSGGIQGIAATTDHTTGTARACCSARGSQGLHRYGAGRFGAGRASRDRDCRFPRTSRPSRWC